MTSIAELGGDSATSVDCFLRTGLTPHLAKEIIQMVMIVIQTMEDLL